MSFQKEVKMSHLLEKALILLSHLFDINFNADTCFNL